MFTKCQRVDPVRILTLDEAKDQLNIIDFTDDDQYIKSLIESATDICERTTNHFFSKTLVKCRFNCLQTYLPYMPFIEVLSVQVDDVDVAYKVDDFSGIITINDPAITTSDSITVNYHAGHTMATIPPIIKQACKIMISDFYNNRESVADAKMTELPLNALMLLNDMRMSNI